MLYTFEVVTTDPKNHYHSIHTEIAQVTTEEARDALIRQYGEQRFGPDGDMEVVERPSALRSYMWSLRSDKNTFEHAVLTEGVNQEEAMRRLLEKIPSGWSVWAVAEWNVELQQAFSNEYMGENGENALEVRRRPPLEQVPIVRKEKKP